MRSSGIFVYYKNYTQNSAWQVVYSMPDIPTDGSWDSEFASRSTCFVGKDYLVHIDPCIDWDSNPETPGYIGYVFNLNTNTILRSEFWTGPYNPSIINQITVDNTNGKVYFDSNYYLAYGIDEFDPETLTFQSKFGNGSDSNYPVYLLSSRSKAYYYDYGEPEYGGRKLYEATNDILVSSFDIDPDWTYWEWDWDVCFRMEEDGSFWWYSRFDSCMKRVGLDGTILDSFDMSGSVTEIQRGTIFHLGDCLVFLEGDGWNNYYYFIS
jgi:hypothetical protein